MTHCEPNTRDRYLLFVSQQKRSFRTARATSTRCNLSNARRMLQGRITRPQHLPGSPSTSFTIRCRPKTTMTTPMKLPVGLRRPNEKKTHWRQGTRKYRPSQSPDHECIAL